MSLLTQTFRGAGFLNCPAVFEAPVYCSSAYAKAILPLRDKKRFAIVRDSMINTGIAHLLLMRAPLAVFLAVMTIIIRAINSFVWRAFAHVFKKAFKCSPSLANFYPPASVMMKGWIFRIVATLENSRPYSIRSGLDKAMLERAPKSCLTTTRANPIIPKAAGLNGGGISARTSTKPFCWLGRCSRESFDSGQFIENFTTKNWQPRSFGGVLHTKNHSISREIT